MIKKYLKYFDQKRRERGEEIYYDDGIEKSIKYNNMYYLKVNGNYKKNYNVQIKFEKNDDIYMNCNCEDTENCKHEFASLLHVTSEKSETLNLDNLNKLEIEKILEYLIKTDSSVLYKIVNYKNKEAKSNKKLSNDTENKIDKFEMFFENFEIEDYEQMIDVDNYDYEYIEEIYEEYDNELINLLKKNFDKKAIEYVKEKIKEYNDYLDEIGLINIFEKTKKYISDTNNYFEIDDIILLFGKNNKKAKIEFEKITNHKEVYEIISKIKLDKKTIPMALKKVDDFIIKNELNNYVYKIIELIILNVEDLTILKKYGMILVKYDYNYEIYKKIEKMCSNEEKEEMCINIINNSYMTDNKFKILYDLEKYDEICEILSKEKIMNINSIHNYIAEIIKMRPNKTTELIKNNIEYILKNQYSRHYDMVIEYLKIMKKNIEFNIYEKYKNTLLKNNSSKSKFKNLCKEAHV